MGNIFFLSRFCPFGLEPMFDPVFLSGARYLLPQWYFSIFVAYGL